MSGIDCPVRECSPRFLKISAASGFNSGLVKSPTGTALSSIVPSAFLTLLTIGPGPEAGSSRLNTVRPHSPERAGIEAPLSALIAGQGEIAAANSPTIVQVIFFPEMLRMFPLQRHGRATLPYCNCREDHLLWFISLSRSFTAVASRQCQ